MPDERLIDQPLIAPKPNLVFYGGDPTRAVNDQDVTVGEDAMRTYFGASSLPPIDHTTRGEFDTAYALGTSPDVYPDGRLVTIGADSFAVNRALGDPLVPIGGGGTAIPPTTITDTTLAGAQAQRDALTGLTVGQVVNLVVNGSTAEIHRVQVAGATWAAAETAQIFPAPSATPHDVIQILNANGVINDDTTIAILSTSGGVITATLPANPTRALEIWKDGSNDARFVENVGQTVDGTTGNTFSIRNNKGFARLAIKSGTNWGYVRASDETAVEINTYYVSQSEGADGNDGLSETTAWQTMAKVNAEALNPGDTVLFKHGDMWRETLTAPSDGTAEHPITFGSYGAGNMPRILGSDAVAGPWTAVGGTAPAGANLVTNPSAAADADGVVPVGWTGNTLQAQPVTWGGVANTPDGSDRMIVAWYGGAGQEVMATFSGLTVPDQECELYAHFLVPSTLTVSPGTTFTVEMVGLAGAQGQVIANVDTSIVDVWQRVTAIFAPDADFTGDVVVRVGGDLVPAFENIMISDVTVRAAAVTASVFSTAMAQPVLGAFDNDSNLRPIVWDTDIATTRPSMLPGTYTQDTGDNTLYVRNSLNEDPTTHTVEATVRPNAVLIERKDNVYVNNIDARYCHYAFVAQFTDATQGTANPRFADCRAYNNLAKGFYLSQCLNARIERCHIEKTYKHDPDPNIAGGHGIHFFQCESPLVADLTMVGTAKEGVKVHECTGQVYVIRNKIYNASWDYNTGGIYVQDADPDSVTWLIENDIIRPGEYQGQLFAGPGQAAGLAWVNSRYVRILSNLIYSPQSRGIYSHNSTVLPDSEVVMRNNIIALPYAAGSGEGPETVFDPADHITTADHNLYFDTKTLVFNRGNSAATTFAQYTASGIDADALNADPQFAAPSSDDFRILPTSPAANTGVQTWL